MVSALLPYERCRKKTEGRELSGDDDIGCSAACPSLVSGGDDDRIGEWKWR